MKCRNKIDDFTDELCGDEGRWCDECAAVEAHYQFELCRLDKARRDEAKLNVEGMAESHKFCDRHASEAL